MYSCLVWIKPIAGVKLRNNSTLCWNQIIPLMSDEIIADLYFYVLYSYPNLNTLCTGNTKGSTRVVEDKVMSRACDLDMHEHQLAPD